MIKPISVNWHITDKCNYKCKYCFVKFDNKRNRNELFLDLKESKKMIDILKNKGTEKINFIGGEPLIPKYCNNLGEIVKYTKSLGMTTSIVTNGYYITKNNGKNFLKIYGKYIDWIGISIDSKLEETEKLLKRGFGNHVENTIKSINNIKEYPHIKIKINSVICAYNYKEDMSELINKLKPQRWKIFQMKHIKNINDNAIGISITKNQFMKFVDKHKYLNPIWEDNDLMTNSYWMIDAYGKQYYDENGSYGYGQNTLLEKLNIISNHIDYHKFIKRGGNYSW